MSKIRILLGSALLLSLAASLSALTRPRPLIAAPGEVVSSTGSEVRLEARSSHAAVYEQGTELFAELTVTLEGDSTRQEPISLALVLDTSGSMSGSKMDDARKAAHRLVELLTDRDELALVSFGTDVVTAARQRLNPESRLAFHAAIDALQPAGSTNLSGGLEAGWKALQGAAGARRLMLVSDGQPTVGLLTELELASLVGRVHDEAITVTALGVGADIDGALMLHLAERGGGMYGYLKDAGSLEEILAREVSAARSAIARNVELELETSNVRIAEIPGRHLEWKGQHTVLYLADLRPHTPTRVLVRLQSMKAHLGDRASLGALVTWRSLDGLPQSAHVTFSAAVVEDFDLVTASRDETVFSRGVNAVGSAQLVDAAQAWERGELDRATAFLASARQVFGMSADALAGNAKVDEVQQGLRLSNGAQERREYARGLQRKKLSDFGLENSGY